MPWGQWATSDQVWFGITLTCWGIILVLEVLNRRLWRDRQRKFRALEAVLAAIAAQETPGASATVKRMAGMAREAGK